MTRDRLDVDPELANLFPGEPDLHDLARRIRDGYPGGAPQPEFSARLRAQLMAEAPVALRPRGLSRLRRRLDARAPLVLTASAGLLGVGLIAVVAISLAQPTGNGGVEVAINAPIAGKTAVDPGSGDAIQISFNVAVDQSSVDRAISIEPATAFTTRWSGTTVTIVPTNHLAPSTPYVVQVRAAQVRAVDPHAQGLQHDIVVAFGTRPAPTATPAPPPVLTTTDLGPVAPGSLLGLGPQGSVLAIGATPASPSPSATASGQTTAGASGTGVESGTGAATSSSRAASLSASSSSAGATGASSSSTASSDSSSASSSSASAAPVAAAGPLVRLSSSGSTTLAGSASAAALSSTGRTLAIAVPGPSGTSVIETVGADGRGQNRVLVTGADAGTPVAWSDASTIVYVADGRLRSVTLDGAVSDLGAPDLTAGARVTLAPGGHWALVQTAHAGAAGPAATATGTASSTTTTGASTSVAVQSATTQSTISQPVTPVASAASAASAAASTISTSTASNGSPTARSIPDVTGSAVLAALDGSGHTIEIAGATAAVAFSVDGHHLAWLDLTGPPVVRQAPVADPDATTTPSPLTPTPMTIAVAGDPAAATLAVDPGGRIAVGTSGDPGAIAVVRVVGADGTLLGSASLGRAISALTFLDTDDVAAVRMDPDGAHAVVGRVPGPTPSTTPLPTAGGDALLDSVALGEATGDAAKLHALPADPAAAATIAALGGHVTQAYVVSEQRVDDRNLSARLRLANVASSSVTFADETLTIVRDGSGAWRVSSASVTAFAAPTFGPHVTHVALVPPGSHTLTVSFDSDLDASTVFGSIRVSDARGPVVGTAIGYTAGTRTATITLPETVRTPVTVTVDTNLRDVSGQALAAPSSTTVS